MNCVSDDFNIVNIMGIRYVSWGESALSYAGNSSKFYVSVNYKGNHQSFGYKTESEAKSFFNKIREAMDKSAKKENK